MTKRKNLAVISTGVPGLDTVLGGGLMEGGLYLVEGIAGAGKTIMSSQMCFHQVRAGKKVLYVTLIAESHVKLMQHLQGMSFTMSLWCRVRCCSSVAIKSCCAMA